jgi:hypothetical protein
MTGELTRVQIGRGRRCFARRIRQGHIAMRSNEINGIAPQARSTHLLTPLKNVERQFWSSHTAWISRVASPYTWTCQSSEVSDKKLLPTPFRSAFQFELADEFATKPDPELA